MFFFSCRPEVFFERGVLKNFAKLTGNTFPKVSFLIKFQALLVTLLKETLAQVFFHEFCNSFKDTFVYRTPKVATSNRSHLLYYTKPISNALPCIYCRKYDWLKQTFQNKKFDQISKTETRETKVKNCCYFILQ